MPAAHRNGDPRICGATTVVAGQDFVFVDGVLWAVEGDPNSHGGGALVASQDFVRIEGKLVIVNAPDGAAPDDLCPVEPGPHCAPSTAGGSDSTFVGES